MDERDRWVSALAATSAEGIRPSQCARIAQLCVELLDVSGAGVSMVTSTGNRSVVCATDDVSARIEDLQFTLGEGPCIDAVRSGAPVLVPDLTEPGDLAVERWPAFMDGAAKAGVRAVFALPLRIGAISVGALDLYRDRPGELGPTELPTALMAADSAALSLLDLETDRDDRPGATTGRPVYERQVHQATGMVQVQLGVTTEEAFLRLRARAFATDRLIAEVAGDVVDRRIRFSTEDR